MMTKALNDTKSDLSEGTDQWLTDHLMHIRNLIENEARRIAIEQRSEIKTAESVIVTPMDIAEATKLYAPGYQVPAPGSLSPSKEESWRRRLMYSITGVTIIAAVLAIVFGVIGFAVVSSTEAAPWLDIAKIFAGAVVGSAGAAASGAAK